ncbi:MAG: pseudouridine-5'-phosphate glycosidase [Actinomycetota bacterium]
MRVSLSAAVAEASDAGAPIVAMESTIFSHLGLPSPHNTEALIRCLAAVTSAGATPALTAVLGGMARLGVDEADHATICGPARKVAARDIGVAIGQAWPYGATTVSASLMLAANAGVNVFATGGIGGVHRDASSSGDISADLDAIASHQVVTVSAGAKIFLDLARTLEYLETASVPVLGWQCDEFPAFHAPSSGLPVPHRVETAAEVAAIARAHWDLGGGGLLLAAPVPAAAGLPLEDLLAVSAEAEAAALAAGFSGAAVTPAVLGGLAERTDGQAVAANLALAEHNASVAARVAVALGAT